MRSAWFKYLTILSLPIGFAHAQVNPRTQINWPNNCNNTPGMVYNWMTNTCMVPSGAPPSSANNNELIFNNGGAWGSTTGMTWSGNALTNPNGTITAQFLIGTTGVGVPQGAAFTNIVPYNSSNNLATGQVACIGTDGTAHPCPLGSQAWSGITTTIGAQNASLATGGQAVCQFDGATSVGDVVQLSTVTAGDCHDSGANSLPGGGPTIGIVIASNSAGSATVMIQGSGQGPPGPPGPPGGSTSYPGVTTDNNNGLNVQGAVAATSLPGFKITPNAPSVNRDQTLAVIVTPQDFCPNAGSGTTDDTACFNAAIRFLATYNTNAVKRLIVPWTPGGYYFSNQGYGYLATMPYDAGDYHGSAGFINSAAANLYFTNGQLTGCGITGGSGYAPNAQLPIQILDQSHQGSGAQAYVQTDSTGAPASTCVVQLAGMNYPASGVTGTVWPLGGSGAQATAHLVSGSFTAGTIYPTANGSYNAAVGTLVQGGSGYGGTGMPSPGSTLVPQAGIPSTLSNSAGNGLICGTGGGMPTFTVSTANASVTQLVMAGTLTGCTYNGSNCATGCDVPIAFGASCGGAQCSIMAQEVPQNIPISVALLCGVQVEGVGNPVINTDYAINNIGYPRPQDVVPFGDPWGDQGGVQGSGWLPGGNGVMGYATYSSYCPPPSVKGLTIKAAIGFWFPILGGGTFTDISFGTGSALLGGVGYYIGTIEQHVLNFNFGFRPVTINNNIWTNPVAGILAGGDWRMRNPTNTVPPLGGSTGNWGGTQIMRPPSNDISAFATVAEGINIDNALAAFNATLPDVRWDTWVEQNLWKSQNGPTAPLYPFYVSVATPPTLYPRLSNTANTSSSTCVLGPGISMATRAIDDRFGAFSSGRAFGDMAGYPWFNCFRGIRNSFLMAQGRYSSAAFAANSTIGQTGISIRHSVFTGMWRSVFFGTATVLDFRQNRVMGITLGTADPYLAGTSGKNSDIWLSYNGVPPTGVIEDWTSVSPTGFQGLVYNNAVAAPQQGGTSMSTLLPKLRMVNVQNWPLSTNSYDQAGWNMVPGVYQSGMQTLNNQTSQLPFNVNVPMGTYRVSVYGYATTPATSGVMTSCVTWNDGYSGGNVTTSPCPINAVSIAAANRATFSQIFHVGTNAGGANTLQISNSCSGNAAVVCNFDWIVERLE